MQKPISYKKKVGIYMNKTSLLKPLTAKKRYTVEIPQGLYKSLKLLANAEDRSVRYIIVREMTDYVKRRRARDFTPKSTKNGEESICLLPILL